MQPLLVALGFCVVCAQKPHQPSSDPIPAPRRHPRRLRKPKALQAETYTAPSWYVENTTYLLVGSWGLCFFLILVMSAVLDGMFDFRGGLSALVALGASTHGVDSFWSNLPRCTTCIYLHYDLQHLLNNSLGLVLAIWFWTTGSQSKVETDWMLYWQLPMWWISSVVGALFSYFTILKRALLTIGASGGCFGYSTGWMYIALTVVGLDSNEKYQRMALSLVSFVPALAPAAASGGAESDWAAHAGGAIAGLVVAFSMLKIDAFLGRAVAIQIGQFLTALALVSSAMGFLLVLYQGCTDHKMRVTSLKALKIVKLEERFVSERQSAGGRVEGHLERERLLNLEERVLDELGLHLDEGPRRHSFLV